MGTVTGCSLLKISEINEANSFPQVKQKQHKGINTVGHEIAIGHMN